MKTFKDTQGCEWQYTIDIAGVGRVMSMTGVNLYKAIDILPDGTIESTDYQRLNNDIALRAAVMYALCAEQAKTLGITKDQFLQRLSAEILDDLWVRSFTDELLDFFPPAKRSLLLKLKEAGEMMQAEMEKQMTKAQEIVGALTTGTDGSSASAEPSASALTA